MRSRWARGGRIALLAGALVLVLTGCSVKDAESKMRFGFPTGVTKQGERMRVLWTWTGVTALAVGIVVWFLIFWAVIRYRKRDDEIPRQTKYNLPLEIVYSIVPFIFIVGLFWRTVVVEDYVNVETPNPDVVVQVDAFKWNWQFEYLKDHGQQTMYTADGKTPLSTVGSNDEIPVLVIPVGETVRFVEHSEDVIHAFWVPEFIFKRDVIPYGTSDTSRDNQFEITATTTGSYVGRCAELCGTYHSQMNFEVRIVQPDVYENYLKALDAAGQNNPARQSQALKAVGLAPYATTTYPFNTDRTTRSASEPTS
ncbi:MAG TPA: cytochrome c oxidase subunit II [Jatrophihabitans sp.]